MDTGSRSANSIAPPGLGRLDPNIPELATLAPGYIPAHPAGAKTLRYRQGVGVGSGKANVELGTASGGTDADGVTVAPGVGVGVGDGSGGIIFSQ